MLLLLLAVQGWGKLKLNLGWDTLVNIPSKVVADTVLAIYMIYIYMIICMILSDIYLASHSQVLLFVQYNNLASQPLPVSHYYTVLVYASWCPTPSILAPA